MASVRQAGRPSVWQGDRPCGRQALRVAGRPSVRQAGPPCGRETVRVAGRPSVKQAGPPSGRQALRLAGSGDHFSSRVFLSINGYTGASAWRFLPASDENGSAIIVVSRLKVTCRCLACLLHQSSIDVHRIDASLSDTMRLCHIAVK